MAEIYYNIRQKKFYIIKHEEDGFNIISEQDLSTDEILRIIRDGAPEELDTFKELINEINKKVNKQDGKILSTNDFSDDYKQLLDGLAILINNKVDKIAGKSLSTNDYTNDDKFRLHNLVASSNYYFDEPYIGSDSPGTGNNILLHGKSKIWVNLLDNKVLLLTNINDNYYSVELTLFGG